MKARWWRTLVLSMMCSMICSSVGTADQSRKYLLETVADTAIVQLYVDGFEQLPLDQKVLIYHLSEAAIAGRDIFIDQKYAPALDIRDLIEEVLTHADGIDTKTLASIRQYAKLFWVHNGPHSMVTSQKEVMTCSFEPFAKAVERAEANGAKLPKRSGESTKQLLERMKPILFDPEVDSHCTSKSPGPGQDILQASANNLYEGVTLEDLEGYDESYALNSKVVKGADGAVKELVYRAGFDSVVESGLYAKQLTDVIGHLEAAIPYATPKMARALGALIQYYRTGESVDRRAYDVAWVADDDSPVDTINGFIEVYMDARGQKGGWEAVVYFNDPKKMAMIRGFSDNAQWFEDHMPYASRYRKPEVRGVSAKAIQVVMETGDAGPVSAAGINLPNPGDIRALYGSKSVSLGNVLEARDKARSSEAKAEFCYNQDEFKRAEKWSSLVTDLEINMHEVIGHGSGKVAEHLKVDPSEAIGEYYSALEEGRADLVALWFLGDPKLVELGLVSEKDLAEIQLTGYEAYAQRALSQLSRIRRGSVVEEDHMRNRQLIVHWLMDNTDAIEVKHREGKTYYVVTDAAAFNKGIGELLAEVQRIKSEGDKAAAEALMQKYAIHFDPKLRDEVVARWDKLGQPSVYGYVMPKLTPVKDQDGAITDIHISYPLDLEAQMLEWSGRKQG